MKTHSNTVVNSPVPLRASLSTPDGRADCAAHLYPEQKGNYAGIINIY